MLAGWLIRLIATAGVVLLPIVANATVIAFEDNFDRDNNDIVGNNWAEVEDNDNDVAIYNSALRIRDKSPDGAATQSGISTAGLDNITLSFDWSLVGDTESEGKYADYFNVFWKPSTDATFLELVSLTLGGLTPSQALLLPVAANNTFIDIKLQIDVTGGSEGVLVDNVVVEGYSYSVSVPEPSTVALLGIGLVGLSFMRRRRRVF